MARDRDLLTLHESLSAIWLRFPLWLSDPAASCSAGAVRRHATPPARTFAPVREAIDRGLVAF
ncbi:hypothetical protein ACTMU2_13085 [Cupriavidus basilensis]